MSACLSMFRLLSSWVGKKPVTGDVFKEIKPERNFFHLLEDLLMNQRSICRKAFTLIY